MSNLPDTNGEVAVEWVEHAQTYYKLAISARGKSGDKVTVKSFVSAAEMALKAVYIKHEVYFPRTHSTRELIAKCPDPSVGQLLVGYSADFVEDFSANYLAPYIRGRPIPSDVVEACRVFAERIVEWARRVVSL